MGSVKIKLFVAITCLLILLAACGPGEGPADPGEGPAGEVDPVVDPLSEVVVDAPDSLLSVPRCEGDFPLAEQTFPYGGVVEPAGPLTFQWLDHCEAMLYVLEVIQRPEETSPIIVHEEFTTTDGEIVIAEDLEPMTSYLWQLRVVPWDGAGNSKVTNWVAFNTGPFCSIVDLPPPALIYPEDGGIADDKGGDEEAIVQLVMEWVPPEPCFPEAFIANVYDNPELTGTDYNIGTPNALWVGELDDVRQVWDDTDPLENCTTYYWRGWATADSLYGPFTETYSFYTDFYHNCLDNIYFRARLDANCRSNPWIAQNEVGIMWEGDTARMLGRDEEGWWGKFLLDNGLECWVHMSSMLPETEGAYFDPRLMDILAHDPRPEPAPEGTGGDDEKSPHQPVTACLVPKYSNIQAISWECVSPCPDPAYASNACTP